ncbi:MAG TPA: alpha/beta fold hydrolase, partial [Accumulibacter sp.]|nr:alpha/beta fold hydrolase [Accumulibacter sp.]
GGTPDDGQDFQRTAQSLADSLPPGCVLGGWSLGALLALQVALLARERLAGLILIAATPCFMQRADWPEAQPAALLEGFAERVRTDPAATLSRFITLFNQGDLHARTISRQLSGLICPLPVQAALQRGLQWLREVDLRQRLAAIDLPILLLHGARDPLNPLVAARYLTANLPQARLEVLAGAAHAPFCSQPELCSQLIADFCDHSVQH